MAQGSPDGHSSTLCKYFMHGACTKGTNCSFSHDRTTPPDLVCRFYLKGQCAYGDRCRYDHTGKQKSKSSDLGKTAFRETSSKLDFKSTPEKKDKGWSGPVRTPSLASIRDSEPLKSNMVPLGKEKEQTKVSTPKSVTKSPEEWVKAKEFTPGQFYTGAVAPTYASAVGTAENEENEIPNGFYEAEGASWDGAMAAAPLSPSGDMSQTDASLLCPYLMGKGECRYGDECGYTHGDVCDMCGIAILHPENPAQREEHMRECMEAHETDMEHSFKVAASREKTCGICMDVVLEKEPVSGRRFGILENCNHCFCLTCIRQWRCAKQFEKVIVKACPECRVNSNFVTPSNLWVDNPEEKTTLIVTYKQALKDKPCRHFDQGRGECPFNDSCFYRHALPDGSIAPSQPRKPRRRHNAEGELQRVLGINLWDFLESEELRREISQIEDSLEIMNYLAMELFDDGMFVIESEEDELNDSDDSDY